MYDYVDEVGGGGRSDLFNALRKPHNAFFFLYKVFTLCASLVYKSSLGILGVSYFNFGFISFSA